MAHAIETAMFVGKPAWHNLGVLLKAPPSIEDAIRLAKLDWTVRLEPLALKADGRDVRHKAVCRDSDNQILGVVGPEFHPLQNVDAFRWFQPMVDSKEVTIEAAGSLYGGRRIWVLGKVANGTREVKKGDPIEQYILLAHGHNGSLAIRVGFTVIRVVCANTLSASLDTDKETLVKIHHRENAIAAMDKVRDAMSLAVGRFNVTMKELQRMAKVKCNDEKLKRYVREVFKPGAAEDADACKLTVSKVVPLFTSGRGAELSRGTMWGAYNAVTEFITHDRGRTNDARVDSQWFGGGAKLIRRAFDVALKMAA